MTRKARFARPHLAHLASILAAPAVLLAASPASANERHFTYTYESGVLAPGHVELEPWTTFRYGKADYYVRVDQRLELEAGVLESLQTAFYWNFSTVAADVEVAGPTPGTTTTTRPVTTEFKSVSSEWKYQLSDPVADALGSALYFEGSIGPVEAELEAKLILDKRLGDFLLAANLVGEHEWEFEPEETKREIALELDLAAGYFVTQSFVAGLEIRSHSELEGGKKLEHSALFAGPVVGVSQEGFWAALTFLPQLAALKGSSDGKNLDLDGHERYETRLLIGLGLR